MMKDKPSLPLPQSHNVNNDDDHITTSTTITSTTTTNTSHRHNNTTTAASGEQRGERRRKRWEKTLARRAARVADIERLRRMADTKIEFARRWDDVYAGTTRSVGGEKKKTKKSSGGGKGTVGGCDDDKEEVRKREREREEWKNDDDDDDEGNGDGGGCLPYRDRHILRQLFPELMSEAVRCDPLKHVPQLHAQSQSQLKLQSSSQPQSQEQQASNTKTIINHNSCHQPTHSPNSENTTDKNNNNITVLEIGCGTGSTIYPLLRANSRIVGIAVDISPIAIAQLRHSVEYASAIAQQRLVTFVHDVSATDTFVTALRQHNSSVTKEVDYVTCIWTLSALAPEMQRACVKTLWKCLNDNGCVLVRDFAVGDMRHVRLLEENRMVVVRCGMKKNSSNSEKNNETVDDDDDDGVYKHQNQWCIRGDGTYAYFFDIDTLRSLFCTPFPVPAPASAPSAATTEEQHDDASNGDEMMKQTDTNKWMFRCEYCKYEERAVHNRKEDLVMRRRWITAKFIKNKQM